MPLRLIKNTILILFLTTYCRLVFYILNQSYFPDLNPSSFFYGLRFDLVSIAYLFSGFYLISLIPFKNQLNKWKRWLMFGFFQIGLNTMLLVNFADTIYYNFTFKRSTGDVFTLAGTGNELSRLIPQFLKDFWYIFLLYIVSVFLFTKLYSKLNKNSGEQLILSSNNWLKQGFGFVLGIGLMIISARGGLQLRPLNMADAPRYAKGPNVAVLVNTPFSILLTFQNPGVKRLSFLEKDALKNIYSPVKSIKGVGGFKGRNVVLIILESFAEEYIGAISGKKSYTPFLDSLINVSYVFKNNRANGLRSIEALPSIFAGIPSINNTPFILSPYASNAINSLPSRLSDLGYETSFFHAGETGTMAFDAFCKNAGVNNYYGLEDYPEKERDFDGAWGIYDEPYLQYFANEMNRMKEPFFSSVFTLSSHHPYSIPPQHKDKFPKGNLNIHETLGYTDYALKQFFQSVKNESWFKNTLFVITADHPAQSEYKFYIQDAGRYKVPLLFFDPNGKLKGASMELSKHADIPTTVLSLLGDTTFLVSFGQDLFSETDNHLVNYKGNRYIVRNNKYVLIFNGEKSIGFYTESDSLWKSNLLEEPDFQLAKDSLTNFGKAYLQQYNNRLIENKLTIGK